MDKNTEILNQIALGLADQGKFSEAVGYFKRSIKLGPNPRTHYLLGLTFQRQGKEAKAKDEFDNALKLDPKFVQAMNGLGLVFLNNKDYLKAEKYFKDAIKLNPSDYAAYNNLGNTYRELKRDADAIRCYLTAIKINDKRPEPYSNLGTIYSQLGDSKNSFKYLTKAHSIDQGYAMATFHLAVLEKNLKHYEKAIDLLTSYIRLKPNKIEALRILGVCYMEIGNSSKASEFLSQAFKLAPNDSRVNNDIGNLLRKTGDNFGAIKYYKKVLEIDPTFASAETNLGGALINLKKMAEAEKLLNRALQFDPDRKVTYYNLAMIYERTDRVHKARDFYQKAYMLDPEFYEALAALVPTLMVECDWPSLKVFGKKLDQSKSEPGLLNLARHMDPKNNLKVAKRWAKYFDKIAKGAGITFGFDRKKRVGKRIKIGYLSCDFYYHATAQLMLKMFSVHNRKKFEIFTYSYGPDDKSFYRKKIEKDSEHFVDLSGVSDVDAAKKINSDEIDILIELKGYTRDARTPIAALKPAPIQVSWLGFPGTTGSNYINYIIADKVVLPTGDQKYFSERPVYLPCYQINNNSQRISSRKFTRKNFGLPEEGVILASFNSTYKLNQTTFNSWMRIMKRVPLATLWLLSDNPETKKNLRMEAKKSGVNPKRIVFCPSMPKEEHLARIRLADICLDTFVYNGHTTTSDCLWAGVPVITLKGKHFASRVSASLLTSIGLTELITTDSKEYEDLAVKLAKSPEQIKNIKDKIEKNKLSKDLFNTQKFVKNLENAYISMWHNYIK